MSKVKKGTRRVATVENMESFDASDLLFVRFYDYLAEKIRLVIDLYDTANYQNNRNYYDNKNPLTAANKIGPPLT